MVRARSLLECLARSLCVTGRGALTGDAPFAPVVEGVARDALAGAAEHLAPADVRAELQALATAEASAYAELLERTVAPLAGADAALGGPLRTYLGHWPSAIRQGLRRPSDPTGRSVPAGMSFDDPAELLRLLPHRVPRLRAGQVAGGGEWELVRYCGLGARTEVWAGRSPKGAEPAALKFVMDPTAARLVLENEALFVRAFELKGPSGLVPLRTVYPDPKRVYLEFAYAPGYDLAGVMFDWKLRWGRPMADPAAGLARRLAEVVAKAHARRFVHRGLKPSNAVLRPVEGSRFVLWVTDFGWGQIAAELARTDPEPERHLRAGTAAYLAPQVFANEPPDPRDDVFAIGRIWYQLLRQDPCAVPDGVRWADPLADQGVPDEHLDLLAACLAAKAATRPSDAVALARLFTELPGLPAPSAAQPVRAPTVGAQTGPASGATPRPTVGAQTGPASGSTPRPNGGVRTGPASGATPRPNGGARTGATTGALSGSFTFGPEMMVSGPVTSLSVNVAMGKPRGSNTVLNSIGMAFALIPDGRFTMGSEADTAHPFVGDELPQHRVRISRPFYLSVFPVTQGEFHAVMGRNPAYFSEGRKGGPAHPVESVTWFEAEQFCTELSALADEAGAGRRYVLPTEAEWEYACRAGTAGAFWCGDKLSPQAANFAVGSEKNRSAPTAGATLPVGQFRPNPWGLYDMHGNVAEWVGDWYSDRYYGESPSDDPTGPKAGSAKVTRGGCWQSLWTECRSAARAAFPPERGTNRIGFRVAMFVTGGG